MERLTRPPPPSFAIGAGWASPSPPVGTSVFYVPPRWAVAWGQHPAWAPAAPGWPCSSGLVGGRGGAWRCFENSVTACTDFFLFFFFFLLARYFYNKSEKSCAAPADQRVPVLRAVTLSPVLGVRGGVGGPHVLHGGGLILHSPVVCYRGREEEEEEDSSSGRLRLGWGLWCWSPWAP